MFHRDHQLAKAGIHSSFRQSTSYSSGCDWNLGISQKLMYLINTSAYFSLKQECDFIVRNEGERTICRGNLKTGEEIFPLSEERASEHIYPNMKFIGDGKRFPYSSKLLFEPE